MYEMWGFYRGKMKISDINFTNKKDVDFLICLSIYFTIGIAVIIMITFGVLENFRQK